MKNLLIILGLIATLVCCNNKEQTTSSDKMLESSAGDDAILVKGIRVYTSPVNVPNHLSPEFQEILSNWVPYWKKEGFTLPDADDHEAWRRQSKAQGDMALKFAQGVLDEFEVEVEERYIQGVRVLDVKPPGWEVNKDKILIHTHGGGFYANTPETSASSYVPLAAKIKTRVISVDYTLMPHDNWSVQNQVDQVVSVYKAIIEEEKFKPENIGACGCSAGGYLALSLANRMSKEGYPIPSAVLAIAPLTDFTFDSDTYATLGEDDPQMNVALFSNITMKMLGITEEMAATPEYSIVKDNFEGRPFPPTMFQVGTKEALLGDNVRMYSVLRKAGVTTEIDPYDAMIHCFHTLYQTPEAKLAFSRQAEWLTKHMKLNQ